MMRKATTAATVLALSASTLLCACGEKPQTLGTPRSDTVASSGTGVANFTSPGWKAGDKTSWEQSLKARQQYGQNEYSRAAAAPAAAADAVTPAKPQ